MAQIRIMSDNAAEVEQVLDLLLEYLRDCPDLAAGSPTRLGHRGGGGRVVFELMPARPTTPPVRVEAERVDEPAPSRPRVARRSPRALPPGRG